MAGLTSQHHTVKTQAHQANNPSGFGLAPPTNPSVPFGMPIQGPSQLMLSAPADYMHSSQRSAADMKILLSSKFQESMQQIMRNFEHRTPDVTVIGELDASHSDFSGVSQHAGAFVSSVTTGKACNSFSVFNANQNSVFNPNVIQSGMGWVAVALPTATDQSIVAVFVHVPNVEAGSIATQTAFYQRIRKALPGRQVDIVMGDTNQGSGGVTPAAVSAAFSSTFVDAADAEGGIQPMDMHEGDFGGTNSTGSNRYDVAVFNSQTRQKIKFEYVSQRTSALSGSMDTAITDHMGIVLEVT